MKITWAEVNDWLVAKEAFGANMPGEHCLELSDVIHFLLIEVKKLQDENK